MKTSTAKSTWQGDLKSGKGEMSLNSLGTTFKYSFRTRFEDEPGTNPEELIGAAHSGCFSMALANIVAGKGYIPESIETEAEVALSVGEQGAFISGIKLNCKANIPNIDEATFQSLAEEAKNNCPVSKALKAVEISMDATLVS
jgi:osmotically inducible protein OsmC